MKRKIKPIGFCAVCEEGIYNWEKTIVEEVEGEEFLIHNRPGCKDIWDKIRKNPRKCMVCGNRTRNMIYFAGAYFIVCEGKCKDALKEKLGVK